MKRLLTLLGTVIALVALVGCEGEVTLTAPEVDYEATAEGAELALTITEVADADGYIIYGDGAVIDTTTALTYDVATPAKLIEVTAYAGDNESEATEIDCAPTTTTSLTVYGLSDPDTLHFSGLAFNATSGTAYTISAVQANSATVEFVFDDDNFATMTLVNSGYYWSNSKLNTSGEDGIDFDAVDMCLMTGYSDQTTLAVNGVYDLWISNSMTWTDTDHFGKVKIESITGSVATITVAYQLIPGLRWVVTD